MNQFNIRICPNCYITLFIYPHPTLPGWLKCEFCAYCEKIEKKK
jgi:hypothetical protein